VSKLLVEKSIDIIGLQETFLIGGGMNIQGYKWFGVDGILSDFSRGPSQGMGFYVQSSIIVSFSTLKGSQSRVIIIKIEGVCDILNVYNYTSDKIEEQAMVLQLISEYVLNSKSPVILIGDFNCWIGKYFGGGIDRINQAGLQFLDMLEVLEIRPLNVLDGCRLLLMIQLEQ
jgi:exonuclease III